MAVAKRVAELEAQLAKTRAERDELLRDVETLCMQVMAGTSDALQLAECA